MVFGTTKGQMLLWFCFARRVLLDALKGEPDANVTIPKCPLKVQSYCGTIRHTYKELGSRRVQCATDGLKLTLQQLPDFLLQSKYYNGWKHDHYVTRVFVFAPDGMIVAMAIN